MNFLTSSTGARLAFDDIGTGLPVVFLHPTPLDHDYWCPLIERLQGVRAIVPDLRGHGVSELGTGLPIGGFPRVPDAPVLTIRQLALDTLELLDQLSVQQAIFVGCSIGGYILLELWRQAPSRMRCLAFVCSKPQPDTEAGLQKRVANIEQARTGNVSAIFDGMAQTLTGNSARSQYPAIVAELRCRMTLTRDALIAVQAGLAARPDSVPTVATINVPVLAVAGGEDGSVTPSEMEAFQYASGGCEYHLLPNSGHLAAFEQPEKVAEILTQWLDDFSAE
jgi:pimeloyl-ACP methyl ester carboxylesterase